MDNAGSIFRSSVVDDMDDKENSTSVQAFVQGESLQTRRRGNGSGSNLRKSLAWNNAFSTDEGVLNPIELSLLSGSATKCRGNFLSGINGESDSLLTSKVFGSNRSGLLSIEESLGSESYLKSQVKQNSPRKLLSDSNSSAPEGPPRHSPGKTSVSKTAYKSTLRSPTANSKQKRFANSCQPDLVSKIPKIKGGKAALPTAPKNLLRTTKCSMLLEHVSPANGLQNNGTKDASLNLKKAVAKLTSSNSGNNMHVAKHGSNMSLLRRPPLPTNSHALGSSIGSGKAATSSCQTVHKFSQGPSLEYAKPSALRMPSPSLGFFLKGKTSSNQKLASESNIQPLRKPENQNSIGQLRILHTSNDQLLSASSIMTKNPPGAGICKCPKKSKKGISGPSIGCFDSNLTFKPTIELHPLETVVMTESSGKMEKKLNADNKEFTHRVIGENADNVEKMSEAKFPGMSEIDSYNQVSSQILSIKTCFTGPELNGCNDIDDGGLFTRDSMDHETTEMHVISQGCSIKEDREAHMGLKSPALPSHVEDRDDTCIRHGIDNSKQLHQDLGSSGLSDSSIKKVGSFLQARILDNVPKPGQCGLDHNISSDDFQSSSTVNPDNIAACQQEDHNVHANDHGTVSLKNEEQTPMTRRELSVCQPHSSQMSGTLPPVDKSAEQSCITLSASAYLPDNGTQCETTNTISPTKECALHLELVDTSRKGVIPLKCQLKAEPFSDEWIAAVEAFGEDILKMKTGAVQNSPTEKALPEPSPWSPVKKTNQDVGPYDCTKYTKSLSSSDV